MSTRQELRFRSETAGPFNDSTLRTLDLTIPASVGVADLASAYVALVTSVDTTDNTDVSAGVRPVAFGHGAQEARYSQYVIVKNAWVESDILGRLDTANDVNIRCQQTDFMSRSGADQIANTVYDGTFDIDERGLYRSNFRDLRYLDASGDSFSGYDLTTGVDGRAPNLTPEIPIYLSKILPFFKNNKFPVGLAGNLKVHIEFITGTYPVIETKTYALPYYLEAEDVSGISPNTFYLSEHLRDPKGLELYGGEPVVITGDYLVPSDVSGSIQSAVIYTQPLDFTGTAGVYDMSGADITGGSGTGAIISITTTNSSVGSAASITITDGGVNYLPTDTLIIPGTQWDSDASLYIVPDIEDGDEATLTTYITGLTHNYGGEQGLVRVTVANSLDASANNVFCNATIEMAGSDADATWEITEASVVVPKLTLPKSDLDEMMKMYKGEGIVHPYFVWDSEPRTQIAGSRQDETFTLPPLTGNVLCVKPRGSYSSATGGITSFRYEVNGVKTTDLPIEPRSTLYYDSVIKTAANMPDFTLKNLDEEYRLDTNVEYTEKPLVMAQAIPLMPEQSQLQLHAEGTIVSGTLHCYKQKMRTLVLKDGGSRLEN